MEAEKIWESQKIVLTEVLMEVRRDSERCDFKPVRPKSGLSEFSRITIALLLIKLRMCTLGIFQVR